MMTTESAISSIGATPYVDAYSAIELAGNIQLTAFIICVVAVLYALFCRLANIQPGKVHLGVWGFFLFSSIGVLLISTIARIWL